MDGWIVIIIIIIIIISLGSRWDLAHGCGPCPAPGELGLLLPREISPTGTSAMAKPAGKHV